MRIVNTIDKHVEFVHIKVGECFIYDNCLFVRMNPVKERGYKKEANAFCFVDNNVTHVPEAWLVTPVDVEVVIRSKEVK